MNVAVIGRTEILYNTIQLLFEKGYNIHSIVTAKPAPEYKKTHNDFEELARTIGAKFAVVNSISSLSENGFFDEADIAISINWISVLQQHEIEKFPNGILNAHVGKLPKYRGNACANWAIINNEDSVSVCVHKMIGGLLDCGNIIEEESFSIFENTTITDVYAWVEKIVPQMFYRALTSLAHNKDYCKRFASIDSNEAFRCYPRLPYDSYINWEQSANNIHNLIRAVTHPFDGAYTYCIYKEQVKKLHIFKSKVYQHTSTDIAVPGHVIENNKITGESVIACGEGKIIIQECKYHGESSFFKPGIRWKSIRMRLGIRAEDMIWNQSCIQQ